MSPKEVKKLIGSEGFQVFRRCGAQLVLADRVRDNLVLDSGVAVVCEEPLRVRFATRAQARDYPGETESELFERARRAGGPGGNAGYVEVEKKVVPMQDPSNESLVLDTRYQVTFEKSGIPLTKLTEELRFVVALKRTA